jgi:hypothetical protein
MDPHERTPRLLLVAGGALSLFLGFVVGALTLHQLRGVEPRTELGEVVVPWLADLRRTPAPLLHCRGRLADFAAECLLEALGVSPPSGPVARLRWRRLRRRLRSRVCTVEDWDALRAEGPAALAPGRREGRNHPALREETT